MADNLLIPIAGANATVRTTNTAGVHTPWHLEDSTQRAALIAAFAPLANTSLQTQMITDVGDTSETAPANDTAASGLNGRLQRVAQNITTLIGKHPAALGSLYSNASLSFTFSNNEPLLGPVLPATAATKSILSGAVYIAGGVTLANGQQSAIQMDANGSIKVAVISGGAGGGGGGQQYNEDAAASNGDLGTLALVVRKDTQTQGAGTDGDYSVLINDKAGRLWSTTVERAFAIAASADITRPARSNAYSASAAVSNSNTAASVTAQYFSCSELIDDTIALTRLRVSTNDTGVKGKTFKAYFFSVDPTANSGIGAGDNSTFSVKRNGALGSMTGTFSSDYSDGAVAVFTPDEGSAIITKPVSGNTNVFYLLKTLDIFTPSGNSTVFSGILEGYQHRA
jgi:hypothetical protein